MNHLAFEISMHCCEVEVLRKTRKVIL